MDFNESQRHAARPVAVPNSFFRKKAAPVPVGNFATRERYTGPGPERRHRNVYPSGGRRRRYVVDDLNYSPPSSRSNSIPRRRPSIEAVIRGPRRLQLESDTDGESDIDELLDNRRRTARERKQGRGPGLDETETEKEGLYRSRRPRGRVTVEVQRDEHHIPTTFASLPSKRQTDAPEDAREELYRTEQPTYTAISRSRSPSQRPRMATEGRYAESDDDDFEAAVFEAANRDRLQERDMDVYDDFGFTCARITETASDSSSASNTFKLEGAPTIPLEPESSWSSDVVNVYSSRYSGDVEDGGSHLVQLSLMQGLRGPSRPLFKWLHIRQSQMNIDQFWVQINKTVRLTDAQKTAIAKLRIKVKTVCQKSRQNIDGQQVGYMEPHAIDVPVTQSNRSTKETSVKESAIRWMCLPYFSLQQYSGFGSVAEKTSFPPVTLLQEQYSRTTRQRDLDQAVCQLGVAEKGQCFHTSQLWSLVLDNDLLVTCGDMARADFKSETLDFAYELAAGKPNSLDNPGRIFVKKDSSVVWVFSASECATWFDFISHFLEFWPTYKLSFEHHGKVVVSKDWPKLLRYVKSKGGVTLTLKKELITEPALKAALRPEVDENPAQVADSSFHVLDLVNIPTEVTTGKEPFIDVLGSQMESVALFLEEKTSFAKQTAYKACPRATRADVLSFLLEQASEVDEKKDDELRQIQEDRVSLFNVADSWYQLFLPPDCQYPTVDKFWGAIMDVMKSHQEARSSRLDLRFALIDLRSALSSLWPRIESFQHLLSFAPKSEKSKITVPREFSQAWLHLISLFVTFIDRDFTEDDHLEKIEALINDGMAIIIRGFPKQNLTDNVAVPPMEILSLISMQLFKDRVGKADDILQTYSQYLGSLDTDIAVQPPTRSHQHMIDLVKQELNSVKSTIWKQRRVIAEIRYSFTGDEKIMDQLYETENRNRKGRDSNKVGPYYNSRGGRDNRNNDGGLGGTGPSLMNEHGLRSLFLRECANALESRDFDLARFGQQVEYLTEMAAYKMERTKDRQENAVYAFTIVTIIFLPLSSIAGIFGMNTSDVRDMDYTQWLYWAVALPLTALVIVGGLWWMNELGNVFRWITGQQRRSVVQPRLSTTVTAPVSYTSPFAPDSRLPPPYYTPRPRSSHLFGQEVPDAVIGTPFYQRAPEVLRRRMRHQPTYD